MVCSSINYSPFYTLQHPATLESKAINPLPTSKVIEQCNNPKKYPAQSVQVWMQSWMLGDAKPWQELTEKDAK
jgi:hypothetical protein